MLFIPESTIPTVTPLPLRGRPARAASSVRLARIVSRALSSLGVTGSSSSPRAATSPYSDRPGSRSTGTLAVTNESTLPG